MTAIIWSILRKVATVKIELPLLLAALVLAALLVQCSRIHSAKERINTLEAEKHLLSLQLDAKKDELARVSAQSPALEAVCQEQVTARETVTRIVYRCEKPTEVENKEPEVISNEKSVDIINLVNDHLRLH